MRTIEELVNIQNVSIKPEIKSAVNMPKPDDIIQAIIRKKLVEISQLKNILESKQYYSKEEMETEILKYLSLNETNYLKAKELYTLTGMANLESDNFSFCDVLGKPQSSEYRLEYSNGKYTFFLPPLKSKQIKSRLPGDGKAISHLTAFLIKDFEDTHGRIDVYKHPEITITHYVKKGSSKNMIPDHDNIDTKSVLDSLRNYLLAEDSILDYTLIQKGETAEKSFTKIEVKESESI